MAQVVLFNEKGQKKVVTVGTPAEKQARNQGYTEQQPEQQAEMAAILKAVSSKKREIALEPGTDLAALRKEMEGMGLMKSGASVPKGTPIGAVESAVCVKPTRLVLARSGDSYYLREDFACQIGGVEFTAFALNNGTEYSEGDSADLEVIETSGTQTGLGLAYIS